MSELRRTFDEVAELFDGVDDPDWDADRDRLDSSPREPWTSE